MRVPEGWKLVIADNVCTKITKGTTPSKEEILDTGSIPFLRVNRLFAFEGVEKI